MEWRFEESFSTITSEDKHEVRYGRERMRRSTGGFEGRKGGAVMTSSRKTEDRKDGEAVLLQPLWTDEGLVCWSEPS